MGQNLPRGVVSLYIPKTIPSALICLDVGAARLSQGSLSRLLWCSPHTKLTFDQGAGYQFGRFTVVTWTTRERGHATW